MFTGCTSLVGNDLASQGGSLLTAEDYLGCESVLAVSEVRNTGGCFIPCTQILLAREWNLSDSLEDRALARRLITTDDKLRQREVFVEALEAQRVDHIQYLILPLRVKAARPDDTARRSHTVHVSRWGGH